MGLGREGFHPQEMPHIITSVPDEVVEPWNVCVKTNEALGVVVILKMHTR